MPPLAAARLDTPVGVREDFILGALKEMEPGQSISASLLSLLALVWVICGLPIDSYEAQKLTEALFLHVRIEGRNGIGAAFLDVAIYPFSSPCYSGPLPDGTTLDRFQRRFIHFVRVWLCIYRDASDRLPVSVN